MAGNDFLGTYAPLANDIATQTGVDPSVVLGIIDTETGGGQHVYGNNIFGISPGGRVAGYPDVQTASQAFVRLMQTPRYAGVAAVGDPASQAAALVKGGYNTANPAYASIVAGRALNFGQQLGYQDQGGGGPQSGASINVSSSQPAPDYNGQPAAPRTQPPAPDYNTPAPAAAPAQPQGGTAKDRVLADPALQGDGGSSTAPAQPPAGATAKDRLLADPALQVPAEMTEKSDEPAFSSKPGEADAPAWMTQAPPSLEDIRSKIQQGDINALNYEKANLGTGILGNAAMVGTHALAGLAQMPINALIGLSQGPSGGATWNPQTGTFGITPEAQSVAAFAANPLRFSGANPLAFVPPGTAERAPIPAGTAANLLSPEARARAAEISAGGGAQVPPVPAAAAPQANAAAGSWRAVQPGEVFQPGGSYRMNVGTGQQEVFETAPQPSAQPTASAPPASSPTGVPVTPPRAGEPLPVGTPPEHAAWVSDVKDRVAQVLKENADAGGPDSLSAAATPPADAALNPAKTKAYRRVSEMNQVLSPIDGEDMTEYVPGSSPSLAERMGDPETSQQETLLRQRKPNDFEAQQGQNNAARVKQYDDQVISDVQAADLKEEQQTAAQRDGARIAAKAGPVDASGVAAWAKERLDDPRVQENPEVYNTIKDLHDRLYDADGNLKDDPRAFWGMHDRLQNMLQKAKDPMSASSNERFSAGQINDFKQQVDGALDTASNGAFRTFLDNQAEFLKQQNAYTLLSKFRSRMTDAKGNILSNRFHQFVTDLAVRRGKPGIDPAMDIPDSTMQNLINIDSDLKRAGRIDLGKAPGSPTNLFFTLSRAMGIGAAHAIVGSTSLAHGGLGNVMLQQGIRSAEERLSNWRMNRLVQRHLAPPPGGLTPAQGNYGNPLQPPP